MNKPILMKRNRSVCQVAVWGLIGAVSFLSSLTQASAQTTNALDAAIDPAYDAAPAPDGLTPGGQNGGFGFGAWTFEHTGNGGAFINGSGPSGRSFNLWNTGANSATIATRPFGAPLSPGQSFSVQLRLNSLDNAGTTNALVLQDENGKTLFMYWHTGFEPNNAVDGHYTDASITNGVAANFRYDYQQFDSFTFTLNSATTYTFKDNTTGGSVSGVIDGTISRAVFFRGNLNGTGGGQDFQFDNLLITTAEEVAPLSVSQINPVPGSYSVPVTNAISAQVVPGAVTVSPSGVTLKVDGSVVTPVVTTGVGGILTINYQPPTAFGSGTTHSAQLVVHDDNSQSFTNDWNFTTGFSSLPATLPGPFTIASSNSDFIVFSAAGDPWLGTNYDANSSRTLYTRFSLRFHDLNGETGDGGGYGGLHFFRDNDARLLVGNAWISLNWSLDAAAVQNDLQPVTPVVLEEWHTIVVRTDFVPGGNDTVSVWLDPDFNLTEAEQFNPPLQIATDAGFNQIRLRCGNGMASAEFSNIVVSTTSSDIGFVAPSIPQFQGFIPTLNAPSASTTTPINVEVVFGTYGISTDAVDLNIDGGSVTPEFTVTPNSLGIHYQPPTPFEPGSTHFVTVSVTDSNGAPYSTSWSFTVDTFPSLPVTLAGPIDVSLGGPGITIFSNLNGWIDGNYQASSTNTLYTRFSMVFFDVNGEAEDGQGGCFGGLHFFQDDNERLLIGETWIRNSWSVDTKKGGDAGEPPLLPVTTVVTGEWHTVVAKNVFVSNAPTAIKVWLDPDFTKSENNQPQAPLEFTMDNTFNNVRLRCGNGSAYAEFTNIIFAATAPEVGFVDAPPAALLKIEKTAGTLNLSWTATGVLEEASNLTGPWTESPIQTNPQVLSTTNNARFFRLRQ